MNKDPQRFYHLSPETPLVEEVEGCEECLAITLSLIINGQVYQIPGANVKHCHLSAFAYGFNGTIGFYAPVEQRPDLLLSAFTGAELISVDLAINAVLNLPKQPPPALTVKGLVSEKSLSEYAYRQVKTAPVLHRYYQFNFCDPAQLLWQQHYPSELYVDTCMNTVIKAQLVPAIKLDIDFPPADTVMPLICLALGNTENLTTGQNGMDNQASFYDFVLAYIHENNGFLTYDYQNQSYNISAQAPPLNTNSAFLPHHVANIQHQWPAIKRSVTNLLNGTADNSQNTPLVNSQAVGGIKHDIMLRHTIDEQYTQRKELQDKKLAVTGPAIHLSLNQWPTMQSCWPGDEISVNSAVDGQHFLYADKQYRCHSLSIDAQALDNQPEKDLDLKFTQYKLSYRAVGHLAESQQPPLPQYVLARYPLYVEGLIISEQGEEDQKTYDVPENPDTGQFEYKINIPLWNVTIKLVLEADFLHSHFYFPLYRNTKLLLAFDLYQAHIVKVLNWGDGVQLPMATQGNHILFGKTSEDQTSLSHIYKDGRPVLTIKRTKQKDTELVQMEEGSIILQTCEEN
jgi:hypothetical protein